MEAEEKNLEENFGIFFYLFTFKILIFKNLFSINLF